jgi:peroxiredoxin
MSFSRKLLIPIGIIAILVLGCGPSTPPYPKVTVPSNPANIVKVKAGDVAPDFTLKDMSGKSVSLKDFRGKKVVLNMWWLACHGCTDEIPFIQAYYEKLNGNRDVVLLAVNVYDPKANIETYVSSKKVNLPILIDPEKKMPEAYVNCGVPTTFFIDKDGVVRTVKDGSFETEQEIEDMVNSF